MELKNKTFPSEKLKEMLLQVFVDDPDQKKLMNFFREHMKFYDFQAHTLNILNELLQKQKSQDTGNISSVLSLLELITLARKKTQGQEMSMLSAASEDATYMETLSSYHKLFDMVWFEFISYKLTPAVHRKVMILMPEKVFPYCDNPVIFTDFFMRAYNFGGPTSLLSLNGLYTLMQEHNLEYPDFYKQLYNLVVPNIFHAKYKARFFYLIDMFLRSTHLPQYLVAAFIKRLARISLTAPAHCLVLTIPFIMNLLSRHPTLLKMMHSPSGPQDLAGDPYDISEEDPAMCHAEESSLWEIKTLQRHYCSMVGHAAMFIENSLPGTESDIKELLEMTTGQMIKKEGSLNIKEIPLNYERPKGLFHRKEDKMHAFWTMD